MDVNDQIETYFTSNGLLVVSVNNKVKIYTFENGIFTLSYDLRDNLISKIDVSDGKIYFVTLDKPKEVQIITNQSKSGRTIECERILNLKTKNNDIVVCTNDSIIKIKEEINKCSNFLNEYNSSFIAYSYDSKLLAYQIKAFGKKRFIIQNSENPNDITREFSGGHNTDIVFLALSPNGKIAVSCSCFGSLRLWDVEKQSIIYKEEKIIKKKNKNLRNVVFSPNSIFVISVNDYLGNNENNIFLFGFVDNQWKFLESFKEESKNIDIFFTSDSSFQILTVNMEKTINLSLYSIGLNNQGSKHVLISNHTHKI